MSDKITRRGLFRRLAQASAAAVVGLVLPKQAEAASTEFIALAPKDACQDYICGNTLLTPEMVTRESLRILHEKMRFVKMPFLGKP